MLLDTANYIACRPTIAVTDGMVVQYGDRETGSSYNLGCMSDRSAISSASTALSRMANGMEHRPTSNNVGVYTKSNMAAAKPEIIIAMVES
jgi:hypothetical protein